MKRRIVVAGIGLAMMLAGCNAPVERSNGEEAPQDGGWAAAPRISAVVRQGPGLVIRGDAPPGARVVLRGDQDTAFAAGADASGRFELYVGVMPAPLLLTPEVRIGQFPAPGPERLLLAGEPGGGDQTLLAAMLIEGGASRRLSPGPALDSVDGDGQGLVAAGRARPGVRVSVSTDGGATVEAVAGADGRWTAPLPGAGDRRMTIRAGGAVFIYPGPAGGAALGQIERVDQGWRLTRLLSPAARQTSWFPDAGRALSLTPN
ncbi:MAG: hypothetical protein P0Y52_06020 [Candidatus Brevundimonas phytovorans]|nr:hypothetical protein [Brevundimonas sp.]WEK59099.1 MAG: hypothetical protein P0Y52_06020 [Brevundimonas sp.]